MRKFKKTLGILAGIGAAVYAGLFAVFYFDLDGKTAVLCSGTVFEEAL